MPLTATATGGADFEPVPEGVYRGICYALYDLGTHYDEMYKKDSHQCLIMWELPDADPIEIEKDGVKKTMPRSISKFYTLSLGDRANLRKDLEGWRGRGFTPVELEGFDIKNILGVACQIQVIHKTNQKGDVKQKVAAVLAMPQGSEAITAVNALRYFSFEDNMDLPAETTDGIAKIITSSKEWIERQDGGAPDFGDIEDRTDHSEDEADNIPF